MGRALPRKEPMRKILLTLALALAFAIASAGPAYAHGESGNYTVVEGDLSLWTIALKLDISFGALLDANWDAPMLSTCLRVGDSVRLP